jgi:hypothetical protein
LYERVIGSLYCVHGPLGSRKLTHFRQQSCSVHTEGNQVITCGTLCKDYSVCDQAAFAPKVGTAAMSAEIDWITNPKVPVSFYRLHGMHSCQLISYLFQTSSAPLTCMQMLSMPLPGDPSNSTCSWPCAGTSALDNNRYMQCSALTAHP